MMRENFAPKGAVKISLGGFAGFYAKISVGIVSAKEIL
jgi:hypothetical protein